MIQCLRRAGTTALLCATLIGCSGGGETATVELVRRDSAGVSIVEHSAAFMAALPEWTIDSMPIRQIRGDTPESPLAIIGQAVEQSDGTVFVADRGLRDVRMFGADGAFQRVVARTGRGPGEVGFVSRLHTLPGDSLGLIDANNRRVSVFDAQGRFARQLLFPRFENGATAGITALLADGRLLGTHRPPWVEAAENLDSLYRTPFALVTYRVTAMSAGDTVPPAAEVDTIAVLPDVEAYRANFTEGGETRADEFPLRFGKSTVWATHGGRTFVATNEQSDIVVYDGSRVVQRIRSMVTPRAVTDDDRARLEGMVLGGIATSGRSAEQRAEVERMVKGWRYAKTHVYANRLLAGTDGSVWVEEPWVLEDDARRYFVHDSTGTALARVVLPPRVSLLRATTRELFGVWRDDDDVPHVTRWRLRPSQ